MRIHNILWLAIISISLCACSTVGDVVPHGGPSMEKIYDDMGKQQNAGNNQHTISTDDADHTDDLHKIRAQVRAATNYPRAFADSMPTSRFSHEFRKIPNPELKVYVYPHFAGNDEVPIPGYTTVFNSYDHDHYELPNEAGRS
jgi:conjugative transfer region lipoprotein (TIGR03751 family)